MSILSSIELVLGEGKQASSGKEYRFNCPFCEKNGKFPDTKWHLYVNIEAKVCHCFRCEYSSSLWKFLRALGISVDADFDTFESVHRVKEEKLPELKLPIGFRTIWPVEHTFDKMYYKYLVGRRVSDDQLLSHKMGYTLLGDWVWRVIIPVYNYGELEYYTGRAISPKLFPKYLNPSHPKSRVVFNLEGVEKAEEFIAVCEGVFSALAWGNNGIALFGKSATDVQVKRIVDVAEKEGLQIIVALDGDAMREAYALADKFILWGVDDIRVAVYPKGSDPGDCKPRMFVDYNGSSLQEKVEGILEAGK